MHYCKRGTAELFPSNTGVQGFSALTTGVFSADVSGLTLCSLEDYAHPPGHLPRMLTQRSLC
ncbi:UNVERIFIED_ORG: hypothetical protein J2W85_004579 [Ensifer adhaerens]|nr:hypothetical protein [Ensifer adhaerens]